MGCRSEECLSLLCDEAVLCQERRDEIESLSNGDDDSGFCPMLFDGWSCVNATRAGEVGVVTCPDFAWYNYDKQSE